MTAAEPDRQLLVFSMHDERYALPVSCVREIIRYVPPTATAVATGLIHGIISLRGRTLPIVDLSSRLGQRLEIDRNTRILVVEVSKGSLGLIVGTVEGILQVPPEQIELLPVAAANDGLGEEIAAIDGRLIVLIDPERALGSVLKGPTTRRRRKTIP